MAGCSSKKAYKQLLRACDTWYALYMTCTVNTTPLRRVKTQEQGAGFTQRPSIKVVPTGHPSSSCPTVFHHCHAQRISIMVVPSDHSLRSRPTVIYQGRVQQISTNVVPNGHPLISCPRVPQQGRAMRPFNGHPSGSYQRSSTRVVPNESDYRLRKPAHGLRRSANTLYIH